MLLSSMQAESISSYRVGRLIGADGGGEVYLADDERLNRRVALKFLPVGFTDDPERVKRFQREARAASALNHPNIATVYEIGQNDSIHYIATEFVEGETLGELMAKRPLDVAEVLDVAIGVASALAAAHDAGIIHRDIKPENIMVRPDGGVKVLDFGLAKLAEHGPSTKESATRSVLGTVLYISPEQAQGLQPDARSDVYSLGTVMYEMLAGRQPVTGDSFHEVLMAITNETPKAPSFYVSGVPSELDRFVLKTLEKNPDDRYASARQLLSDLRTLRQERDFTRIPSVPVPAPDGPPVAHFDVSMNRPIRVAKPEVLSNPSGRGDSVISAGAKLAMGFVGLATVGGAAAFGPIALVPAAAVIAAAAVAFAVHDEHLSK